MRCPVCNIPTVIVEYNSIELDYCTGCRGVWFDAGELELLLESAGLEDIPDFLESIVEKTEVTSAEKKRKCPVCSKKMKKAHIDESGRVLVDICGRQHGIWFDGMEVQHFLDQLTGESSEEQEVQQKIMSFFSDVFKY